jgi:hypothetical protein
MNCFTHDRTAAVGVCGVCQKAVCHECVARETPYLVCRSCAARGSVVPAYAALRPAGYGYEYTSAAAIGSWPLVHICSGIDPVTMRPRVAKGVLAIGNVAVGVVAIGGIACGLLTLGGASLGLLFAIGGAAVGLGLSVGGFAVGSIAIGGAAVGFVYALGGGAFGPAVIDGRQCDEAAVAFLRRWLAVVPKNCR